MNIAINNFDPSARSNNKMIYLEKITKKLIYGLVLFFFLIITSGAFLLYFRFIQIEGAPIQGVVNSGFMARLEYSVFRMRLAIALAEDTPSSTAAAAEAYDILLSRIYNIDSNQTYRLPTKDQRLLSMFQDITQEIKSWDQKMIQYASGEKEEGARLLVSVNNISIKFSEFTNGQNIYAYNWHTDFNNLLKNGLIVLIFITLTSSGIMGFLVFRVINTARHADRAQRELIHALRDLSTAKEAAEQANQIKSKFLANVSHELRTPLNAIIGFSEILKDKTLGVKTEEKHDEYLGYVVTSGQHLLSLINEILDFSKIQQGQWVLSINKFSIEEEISDIIGAIMGSASKEHPQIFVRYENKIEDFFCDQRAFRQIIFNPHFPDGRSNS